MLADNTKVGLETMCQTVPLHQISILITDDLADPHQVAAIREAGVQVRVAQVPGRSAGVDEIA